MRYLCKESFEIVDGPLAGRKFTRGQEVDELPPGEDRRFEPVAVKRTSPPKKQDPPVVAPAVTDGGN